MAGYCKGLLVIVAVSNEDMALLAVEVCKLPQAYFYVTGAVIKMIIFFSRLSVPQFMQSNGVTLV